MRITSARVSNILRLSFCGLVWVMKFFLKIYVIRVEVFFACGSLSFDVSGQETGNDVTELRDWRFRYSFTLERVFQCVKSCDTSHMI